MPVSIPVATKNPGDLLTAALWNGSIRDNINKLLDRGHRVLTVAQFAALTGLEGTKGTVAPDEVYLEVDSANGILWHLAYESGETTYKWRFLGGPPMASEITTLESTTSVTYTDLATAGPAVTLPRAGDYDVSIAANVAHTVSNQDVRVSYAIGGTAASVNDDTGSYNSAATALDLSTSRIRRKAALTSVALTMKYKANGSSASFFNRRISVTPTRIRHDA